MYHTSACDDAALDVAADLLASGSYSIADVFAMFSARTVTELLERISECLDRR